MNDHSADELAAAIGDFGTYVDRLSRIVGARIEADGMKAENAHRAHCGASLAYGEDAFSAVLAKWGITP